MPDLASPQAVEQFADLPARHRDPLPSLTPEWLDDARCSTPRTQRRDGPGCAAATGTPGGTSGMASTVGLRYRAPVHTAACSAMSGALDATPPPVEGHPNSKARQPLWVEPPSGPAATARWAFAAFCRVEAKFALGNQLWQQTRAHPDTRLTRRRPTRECVLVGDRPSELHVEVAADRYRLHHDSGGDRPLGPRDPSREPPTERETLGGNHQ
ncbi:hypothetical protein C1Y40_05315 [Mycobacterium talmoniae]|uniref:Uncharacterized protein n=1 Tax=Mycobacterium talmoniae TaxID=1858794 RepID=A0A2S8BCZ9_9MYCO|nr:hypothetical protein C1Y40_05315 [Mycobacterium talmoniae]